MSLCMGCMQEIGNNTICPSCGFDNSQAQPAPFLPYGTVLNSRYIVGAAIDNNGESVRYTGFDKQTGDVVIICEFLPVGLFDRPENQTAVEIDFSDEDIFNKLLNDFVSYYSVLEELRELSALLKIHDVFKENNTAYAVEENEDLIPFEEYVSRSSGHLDWDIARPLFMPVISSLEAMHKRGIGHFAIAPKNLYVSASGKIKISGFATSNERKRGTEIKSQLFSGCAAPEQYLDNFPIDNITDIYGFSATLFYALTGNLPNNAQERLNDSRLLMSTNTVKRLPPHVVTALANGLQVKRENRITDFDDLRSQLSLAPTVQAIQEEISRTASMNKLDNEERNGMSHTSMTIIAGAITALIMCVVGVFVLMQNPFGALFNNANATQETSANEEWTGPTVPNYVGKNYSDVVSETTTSDTVKLYRAFDDQYSDEYAAGVIMAQSPDGNSEVAGDGSVAVTLIVSKGPQMRELPEVTNKKLDDIAESLGNLGFIVTAEYQYADDYAKDRVIAYKDYKKGDKLEDGTQITIVVSKGSKASESSSSSNSSSNTSSSKSSSSSR